ncbi:YkgJ family cysteine cluster protein [Acinetobacter sp. ME22]|uniref:YkgJ family cysteine cluster protein n=1 Tax=Acinetobacter sp. ME22 TaxID=2904802 RepID=UPI003FA426BC
MTFPCTRCGLCCLNIKNIEALKEFHRGDGRCFYYHPEDGCAIYKHRPLICRIENMYQKYFTGVMSKNEFYRANAKVCNTLQEQINLPLHHRVRMNEE